MPYFSEDFFVDELFPRSRELPFGDKLEKLFFAPDPDDNGDFPIHGPNVIRLSRGLLSREVVQRHLPSTLAGFWKGKETDIQTAKNLFSSKIEQITQIMEADVASEKEEEFLGICALYHDLGKVIRRANHPQIGTNLLRNSEETETRKLIEALHLQSRPDKMESAENRFARLASVVQHHDKFGVVSTGEGGLPIFSDIPYFRSDSKKIPGIGKNITTVMLLNLADIAAVNKAVGKKEESIELAKRIGAARAAGGPSDPQAVQDLLELCRNADHCKGLTLQTVIDVLGDWEILLQAVEENKGDRGLLKKRLLEYEQNPYRAINRILRLLKTASVSSGAGALEPHFSLTGVESVLVGMLGAHQLQNFCDQLASVVKFDYGLGFFEAVICGCVRCRIDSEITSGDNLKSLSDEEKDYLQGNEKIQREIAQVATERFVQVIKGFLERYVGVLGSSFGTGRRFGIQMRSLGDKTILKTIIDFLCMKDKEFVAVTWIADEVSLWSLD